MYFIELKRLSHFTHSDLKNMWFTVAQTAIPNIFLSWPWIDSWLSLLKDQDDIYVITASHHNQCVGIGIFVEKHVTRHGFFKSKQWYLHRTGDDKLDQIWIEKNNFLVSDQNSRQITSAMWQHLFLNQPDVDEFIVNVALDETSIGITTHNTDYQLVKENIDVGYLLAINAIKDSSRFPQEISNSTYKHVERTIRRLNQDNDLTFEFVTDPAAILNTLEQLSHWHITKWEGTTTPSGFNNDTFQDFHSRFIRQKLDNACIAVLSAGGEIIGVNYYLRHKRNLAFYLSCIKPITDNKIKIGLALHCLVARQAHTMNIAFIDYLAGDADYKRKLSNNTEAYCQITVQKRQIKFKIEASLGKLKRRFLNVKQRQ
ncbi:GNAT family N-acetyltransferase [Psychrosphaera sp. B3R10]|uniref:GNAT family N-acetyltransferase n=1 Tax=unclassified Psychrosphaera TaxID=2641570 RepID=UPI001C08F87C|nr:GNAT family N-acetyltransferase [Psychrosphaera sp. I2R16]MBU2987966.1 GNAT family N-acetyltransferase [Psychrosphaera sp. B3R10]